MWGGSRVACVDPEVGREVASIALPCPNATSCCFGGEKLDRLWITTARVGLDDAALENHPASGGLFVAEPGAVGLPTTPMG
jgi:sugar lactone lactonase YvrE